MFDWYSLFSTHIQCLQQVYAELIDQHTLDGILIHSGSQVVRYLDDSPYPYWRNPRFCQWVPAKMQADSVLVIRPGIKPLLLWYQPVDFWHAPADDPSGFWVNEFDIKIIENPKEIALHLPKGRFAGLGPDESLLKSWGVVSCNLDAIINALDWQRGVKTSYEQACIQEANNITAQGHKAALIAFEEGQSEFDIQLHYLKAVRQKESEMPYSNIIAMNENTAVLHYDRYQTCSKEQSRSFLIDAGATYHHYAADITRTYAREPSIFQNIIKRIDAEVLNIIKMIEPGVHYEELHDTMHRFMAKVLTDFELLSLTAEEVYEKGYTRVFFPHGLGHLLGLTVHDAGGKFVSAQGKLVKPDDRYPTLRCQRVLEEGMVLTIEPGLYFIPQLLSVHKGNNNFNWALIDTLIPFGGVRIEDNVVVTKQSAFNYTREALLNVCMA